MNESLFNNEDNAYNIPHISQQLADYLKGELSADAHINRGLLSDSGVIRTEGYLLGFLAGLSYSSQFIDVMLQNQKAVSEDNSMLNESGDTEGFSFI